MVDSLTDVLKKIKKQYGDSVVKVGVDALELDGVLSLGSPSFDFCVYGGVPEGRIIELSGQEGSGKAQPLWSPVFTPDGYKCMGDLNLNDLVIDGKGNCTKVIGIYDRGELPTYKVSFNDGTYTICAEDHLWKVYNHSKGNKPKTEILTTSELLTRNLHQGCWGYSVDVPVIDVWTDNNLKIHPYLLGALIGDGSLSANNLGFTNSEADVVLKVSELLKNYHLTLQKYNNDYEHSIVELPECKYQYEYIFEGKSYFSLSELRTSVGSVMFSQLYKQINAYNKGLLKEDDLNNLKIISNPYFNSRLKFKNILNEYGLSVKSIDKHIPKDYLFSSYQSRLQLIQGLYDTDGYTASAASTEISTSSEQLSIDIAFLLRSLGCRVTVSRSNTSYRYKYRGNDEIREAHDSFTLRIKTPPNFAIATSTKHLQRFVDMKDRGYQQKWWRSIVSIEYYGKELCRCIMVDSSEHTYLTDDFICTHNTTTAFLIAASYQRRELERHPLGVEWTDNTGIIRNGPRSIILLDNEGTADPAWAIKLGYDMNEDANVPTIIIRPEAQSAEEIFDMALNMLKTGEVGLLIFDSIATLVPQQIADESMEKQQMGGIAKALTRFANTAIGLLRKYKATLVAINQVRDNMTGYGDALTTPGGRSWKHACSMRLMFKRGEFFDEDGNTLTKSAESPAGHVIEVYVLKTKVCKWDRKLGYLHLNYTKGVDVIQDTIDVATHLGFIDNSVQGSFKLIDPDTGELICDENGDPIKIRGKRNVGIYFKEHKDIWKKVYDKCYEKLSKKEEDNIISFEQMLNIDLNQKLGIELDNANLEEL